jgi:hypothetical protein
MKCWSLWVFPSLVLSIILGMDNIKSHGMGNFGFGFWLTGTLPNGSLVSRVHPVDILRVIVPGDIIQLSTIVTKAYHSEQT